MPGLDPALVAAAGRQPDAPSSDALPIELREHILVLYRVGLRRRMAERRRSRTRLGAVHRELVRLFAWAHGDADIVRELLRRS